MSESSEPYVERRTKHALRIDRALNARSRYDDFIDKYRSSPNRSDVNEYDTRKGKILRPPGGVIVPEVPKERGYKPIGKYRLSLVRHFHRVLSRVEQHKDLLVTKNVIERREDVVKWRKDPKWYDVVGIDTQPKGLIAERIKVLHGRTGATTHYERMPADTGGFFSRAGVRGSIHLNVKDVGTAWGTLSAAHEGVHAWDANVLGRILRKDKGALFGAYGHSRGYEIARVQKKGIKRVGLGYPMKPSVYVPSAKKLAKIREGIWAVGKKVNPVGDFAGAAHMTYRRYDAEQFANWGAGLIMEKGFAKRHSRDTYNVFRKSDKVLWRGLRASDARVTAPFLGGKA